jgi:RNA polymerase primary sigma factor
LAQPQATPAKKSTQAEKSYISNEADPACARPGEYSSLKITIPSQHEPSMGDALSDYMHAISRIPLLTAAEEVHLATIIQQWQNHPNPGRALERRGRRALDRMVEGNLRLVVSICKRYQNMASQAQIEMLDLIQAGSLGLIRAVRGFDPSRGYKFSTYGYWWIRQSISRHIKERGQAIRVPPEITNLARRVQEQRAQNPQAGSLQNAAERLGVSMQRLEEVLRIHHFSHIVSLDQVCAASGDGDHTLLDLIRGDDHPTLQETYEWLHRHLRELKPEEQQVLQLRFSAEREYSFSQVAAQLGLKKSQVQWLEKHALRKLQKRLREGGSVPGHDGGSRRRPA